MPETLCGLPDHRPIQRDLGSWLTRNHQPYWSFRLTIPVDDTAETELTEPTEHRGGRIQVPRQP